MSKKQILFGICGSFCNHARVLHELYWLKDTYDLHFVISEHVAAASTRFFKNTEFRAELEQLSDAAIIDSKRKDRPQKLLRSDGDRSGDRQYDRKARKRHL